MRANLVSSKVKEKQLNMKLVPGKQVGVCVVIQLVHRSIFCC